MIIRSQDKRRTTTDLNLYIESIEVGTENIKRVFIRSEKMGIIGTYSTEEKAIKVLDMIQNKYFEHMTVESNGAVVQILERPKVFQMPQDSEVYHERI